MIDGTAKNTTPLETALIALARKAHVQPRHLNPGDLDDLRALVGEEASDYVLVLGMFHFINRIADLLNVDMDVVPETFRAFSPVRSFSVGMTGAVLSKTFDLKNRCYDREYDEVCKALKESHPALFDRIRAEDLSMLKTKAKFVEVIALTLDEQEKWSSLDHDTLQRVQSMVEESLPGCEEDTAAFHPRPTDPIEAFAFVGTRYAQRATAAMVEALRDAGYDDIGILDLASAIANANMWARMYRLLGLNPAILYSGELSHSTVNAASHE